MGGTEVILHRQQKTYSEMKTTPPMYQWKLFYCFVFTYLLLCTIQLNAQNFSGLENKKLNKLDDVTGLLTGLISKLDGKVESVTVTYDSERTLKLSIAYTGLSNAYFKASVLDAQKKQLKGTSKIEYSLEGKTSPLEIEFALSGDLPEGLTLDSPYLEIKLSKSKNEFVKNTNLYNLNKQWKTDVNPENITIQAVLDPIGSAANLKENNQKIIIPKKKPQIKLNYNKAILSTIRTTPTRTLTPTVKKNTIDGTWVNTNANTRSITKVVVSNNGKNVRVYGKCSPRDCDWGTKTLSPLRGLNMYRAVFDSRIATSTFTFTFNKNLTARHTRKYKSQSRVKTTTETFKKLQIFMPIYTGVRTTTTSGGTTQPEEDKTPQGPDNNPISLWEDLVADNDFEFPYEITNIRMDVYPDKNLKSGVFYYLPNAYHLRWNADERYKFRMLYGEASEGDNGANVRMVGTLTPGISSKEIALIKTLLESYVKSNTSYKFTDLKIIPIQSAPKISLSSGLEGQYDISSDKINVNVTSSISNPIDISWVTDTKTKEEIQVALSEGVGVQGAMTLVPDSESVPEQLIPVRITLADKRTLGKFMLQPNSWRDKKWKNETQFPLKLKMIHALIIEKQGNKTIPIVYSWSLNNVTVPAKASVEFDTSKMPKWIETKGKTEQIWIDYSIDDCPSCVDEIIEEISNATSLLNKEIAFESVGVFESIKPAFMKIKVRTKQADPKGKIVIELPTIRIDKDMEVFSTGPLYLKKEDTPNFEYQITVVMPDGEVHRSDSWIFSDEVDLILGSKILKENISSLNTTPQD